MTFKEVLAQVIEWLQQDERVSYRALKRQFDIDDAYLEDLKFELIKTKKLAVDEGGEILAWSGESPSPLQYPQPDTDSENQFQTLLRAVMGLLQREKRVTYRTLKYLPGLDNTVLEEIRKELTFRELARDDRGEGLVWTDDAQPPLSPSDLSIVPSRSAPAVTTSLPTSTLSSPDTTWAATREPSEGPSASYSDIAPDDLPAVSEQVRRSAEAERRQLTVMFCDLVGSTDLSGRLDPEDWREVVRAYQATAAEVIERYGGHIAQYLGDGLLVYFGWPQAHENGAERAVYTGLEIPEAITALNPRLESDYGVQLAVRIGIHTGSVVVGEMGGGGRHENLALGETPSIAARLEGLAQANTVVISSVTARLVQRSFVLTELGSQELKGVAEPMQLFVVVGPRAAEPDDQDSMPGSGFEVLVGRDEEIGLLLRRWEQSKEGLGQVVLIRGEAGIGKSSMVEGLRHHVGQEGIMRITYHCSPYHINSALYPIIDQLQRSLNWQPQDTVQTQLEKLEQALESTSLPRQETVSLLASLLSLPLPEGHYPDLTLTPQQQRQQTQEVLVAWLLEEAEHQPVLVVWEDLHWADPSTLDILGQLVEQTPTAAMLNVLTFRPEFDPPWPTRSHLTPISLSRLERPQVEALVRHLAGGKSLPSEVNEHIITKTDGVPLFAEELTKMLLASSLLQEGADRYTLTGSLSVLTIPTTLQDSLMARLDQLGSAKDLAQLGAVLGREFPYEMLRALRPGDDVALQASLNRLVEAELLYQRGRPPRSRYRFKHALIQDAAYSSLLNRQRQQYHRNVAHILEAQCHRLVETQPELVAHHFAASGNVAKATRYWQEAGEQAFKRSANAEAIRHFTDALDGLSELSETDERIQREFDIYLKLAPAYFASKGSASLESGRAYQRLRELCTQVGQNSELASTLIGLFRFYSSQSEHRSALEISEQLHSITRQSPDSLEYALALYALGINAMWRGELPLAYKRLTECRALYASQPSAAPNVNPGHDPNVAGLMFGTLMLWALGYPDQARQWEKEAVELTTQLSHPYGNVVVMILQGLLQNLFEEDWAYHQERIESAITLTTEYGFPLLRAQAMAEQGWFWVVKGEHAQGIEQLRHYLSALKSMGGRLAHSFFYAYLIKAFMEAGQLDEGLRALDEAMEMVEDTEERFYQAELYRLKGILFLKLAVPDVRQAEVCFQKACDISRIQEAKSWELRATTSLAKLWQAQGKLQAAYDLLAPVYDWFTEGFDTADLIDAKALLDELA